MLQPDAAYGAGLQIDRRCQIGIIVLGNQFYHKKIPPCGAVEPGKNPLCMKLYVNLHNGNPVPLQGWGHYNTLTGAG